jgi:two-component system OmpR family response regulator
VTWQQGARHPTLGPVRVLVVDDEVRLAEAVARGLVAEGFDVDVSHDGLDGLWRAREHQYGAIVLDLLLPGMNGFEVCRTLRDEGNWTPILMLTAKSGEYDEAEALDTGADDFLSKPFSFVVLTARVRAVARRGSTPRPAALSAGTVVVEPATREVRVSGNAVELTPREFSLLEALVRRSPGVVTKQELLGEVWGNDRDVDPNAVEVYVGYLRRKLGRHVIDTVRGAGYRVIG